MVDNSIPKGYKQTKAGVIPEDWDVGEISTYFHVIGGTTPSTAEEKYWNGGTNLWITPADLSANNGAVFINESERKITDEAVRESGLKIIPKNSIILSTRAPVGHVAITNDNFFINQGCKALIPDKSQSDPFYYYFYLLSQKNRLNRLSGGSTFNELSKKSLERLNIPIPPLNESNPIGKILFCLEEAIATTEAIIARTEELKRGFMQVLLTRGIDEEGNLRSEETHAFKDSPIGRVPVEWEILDLNDAIHVIDCKHYTPKYVESGYPVIRPQNISNSKVDFSKVNFVNEEDFKILTEKHLPNIGDILYSRNASVGMTVLIEDNRELCIGQDMVIMTEKSENSHYIFYCLCSELISFQLNKLTAGSTFKRINLKDIRCLKTPIPPLEEQCRIASVISLVCLKLKEELEYKNELFQLKRGLMQDLLTGRVRVPEEMRQETLPSGTEGEAV